MFTLCVNSTYTASVTDYHLNDMYGLGYWNLYELNWIYNLSEMFSFNFAP